MKFRVIIFILCLITASNAIGISITNAQENRNSERKLQEERRNVRTILNNTEEGVEEETSEQGDDENIQLPLPVQPAIDSAVEQILNETVPPTNPVASTSSPSTGTNVSATTTATTSPLFPLEPTIPPPSVIHPSPQPQPTPVQPKQQPSRPRATTTPLLQNTTDRTEAGPTHQSTPEVESPATGGSNQFSPLNYYTPLDRLSPTMTYALCTLALLLGAAGSLLIIRDAELESDESWIPPLVSRSSLLES